MLILLSQGRRVKGCSEEFKDEGESQLERNWKEEQQRREVLKKHQELKTRQEERNKAFKFRLVRRLLAKTRRTVVQASPPRQSPRPPPEQDIHILV